MLPEVTVATWMKSKLQTDVNNAATRHFWIESTRNSPSWKFIMSDNKKQEKDYTKEVDALLPEAEALVKVCLHIVFYYHH